jgi:hypothetical protein
LADHHQSLPPQETLAVMNSHLGRFLVQADELIQECRSFGESLRTSLEAELDKLNDTLAHTLDSAAQRTAEQAGARFGAQLETALGGRLAELRQKLDEMSRLADRAAAARADTTPALPAGLPVAGTAVTPPARRAAAGQPWPRALTVLVATANLMLAALLVLMLLDLRGGRDQPGGSGAGAGAGAGTGAGAGASTAAGADDGGAGAGTGAAGAGTAGAGTTGTGGATSPDVSPGTGPGAPAVAWAELCQPLAESADPAKAHALVAAAAAAACGERAGAVTANVLAGVRALPAAEGKPQTAPAPAEKPSRGARSRSRGQKP